MTDNARLIEEADQRSGANDATLIRRLADALKKAEAENERLNEAIRFIDRRLNQVGALVHTGPFYDVINKALGKIEGART